MQGRAGQRTTGGLSPAAVQMDKGRRHEETFWSDGLINLSGPPMFP